MKNLYIFFSILLFSSSCSMIEESIDSLYKEGRSSEYIVKENDTLWSIAIKNNTTPQRIAIRNSLKTPYVIFPGQVLLLSNLNRVNINQTIEPEWSLPTSSSIKRDKEGKFWLIFNGGLGDPVYAVEEGKVVLSGSVLPGYGNFIMIDHGNDYLSLYAHCDELFIKKGDLVSKNQLIASIGSSETNIPKLKFQIRKDGIPINIDNIKF